MLKLKPVANHSYFDEQHEHLPIDYTVTDDLSGVYSVNATLDGIPVSQGYSVDLLTLSLGEHTFAILAEDTAGNVSQSSVTFTIEATLKALPVL